MKYDIKKLKDYDISLFGSIDDSEVTDEIANKYGYSLKDIDQTGFRLIEGSLGYLDKTFAPLVEGYLKEIGIKEFSLDSAYAEKSLPSLKNKPFHINADLNGHYDENNKQFVIGSLLGGRIEEVNGDKAIRFLGGIYDQSNPIYSERIHKEKKDLGASFEVVPTEIEINGDSLVAQVKSWVFKGAAILKKEFAAFPDTSLLIAQKANTTERGKFMDKIYSQLDLDNKLVSILAETKVKWDNELKNSELVKSKEKEISDLKAQVEDEKKTAEAEQDKVKTEQDKVKVLEDEKKVAEKKAEDEKKETAISAQAGEWLDKNKESYDEKDKDTLLDARKAIIRGDASVEQTDRLINLRKASKTDLYAQGGGRLNDKSLDVLHGINIRK